jgi:hypothetical protein
MTKIESAEENFKKTERCIAALRAFFAKHAAALEQIEWRAYGWNEKEISINHRTWGENPLEPKQIASLFGLDGWTRRHNSGSCGAVNWLKELDGCTLIIENAESIKPKLIETVKFHTEAAT